MPRVSPTAEGFRAAFHLPSLTFAEIIWRWTVGATAAALFFFALIEYLGTLPVTNGDLLLLRSGQPIFVGQAISHILRGSAPRVVIAAVLGALPLTFLWVIAASLGRLATVRNLRDYFATRFAMLMGDTSSFGQLTADQSFASPSATQQSSIRALFGLNFLRATVILAAILGFFGAQILAGFISTDTHPRPGIAFLLFLPLAALICLTAAELNWILSLAGIFAVRDAESALGALVTAVAFFRERLGPIFAVSSWFGLIHVALFMGASSVIFFPLGFAAIVPGRLVIAATLILLLAYFALADWLYLGRLAAYICIAEMPEALRAPLPVLPYISPSGGGQIEFNFPPQTAVDQSENILSDVPGLA